MSAHDALRAARAAIFEVVPERIRGYEKMRSALAQIDEALALLQSSAPEWETIETAPKDGMSILVWNGYLHVASWRYGTSDDSIGKEWRTSTLGSLILGVTHWQPEPAPPGSLASRPAASPELIGQLEAVAGLAEKATAGPWDNDSGLIGTDITGRRDWSHVATVIAGELEQAESDANAAFIAAVRSLPFAEIVVALKGGR